MKWYEAISALLDGQIIEDRYGVPLRLRGFRLEGWSPGGVSDLVRNAWRRISNKMITREWEPYQRIEDPAVYKPPYCHLPLENSYSEKSLAELSWIEQ